MWQCLYDGVNGSLLEQRLKGQLTCEGIQNQMVLRDPCYIHVRKVPLYHVIPFIPCLSHFLMLVFLYHVTPILSLR